MYMIKVANPITINQIPSLLKTSLILCGDIDVIIKGNAFIRGTFSFLKKKIAIKKHETDTIGYITVVLIIVISQYSQRLVIQHKILHQLSMYNRQHNQRRYHSLVP